MGTLLQVRDAESAKEGTPPVVLRVGRETVGALAHACAGWQHTYVKISAGGKSVGGVVGAAGPPSRWVSALVAGSSRTDSVDFFALSNAGPSHCAAMD